MTKRKTPPLPPDKQRALDERRQRQRELFADPEAITLCLEDLAEGMPLTGWCEMRGFATSTVRMWLMANRPNEYGAIRITVADGVLDEIAEIEREMARSLRGEGIDPVSGEVVAGLGVDRDKASYYRELLKTKMWRVEKLNPGQYGQRQNIDMRVTDVNKLQLDAIRELSRRQRAAAPARLAPLAADRLPPLEGQLVSRDEPVAAIPHGQTSLPRLQAMPSQLAEPAQPAKPDEWASGAVVDEPSEVAMVAEPAMPAKPSVWAKQAEPARTDRPANVWAVSGAKVAGRAPPDASRPRPHVPSFVLPPLPKRTK